MICQWYPALAPQITAFYDQGIEFRQALLNSFQNSESLYDRIGWFDEEENARLKSSRALFSPLDPITMAVDTSDSMLTSAVQEKDLNSAPSREASSGTCSSSQHFKSIDDHNSKIHLQETSASKAGRLHRTGLPQLTMYTNLPYEDGGKQGMNQRPGSQCADSYDRRTLVQFIENSTNPQDDRSPTIDFEFPCQEAQAARQQITLPEKISDSAIRREKGITRTPDDNDKVGIQSKEQGQGLRKPAGRYELKDQVKEKNGAKAQADGEELGSSYEDDNETVGACLDLVREKKSKRSGTTAIGESLDLDGQSSNHQSNKRARQDTGTEDPLSKQSKLTANVDIEFSMSNTTTISTEFSPSSESYWRNYDTEKKAQTGRSPEVNALRVWKCPSTKYNSGIRRSRRGQDRPLRNTDDLKQSAREGLRYKGCRCPVHQGMYEDWPAYDAELTIAPCMKTCVYCGNMFRSASELRRHLRGHRYARKNLRVHLEDPGKLNPITPSWNPRLKIIEPNPSQRECTDQSSKPRTTRSQANKANAKMAPCP